MEWQDLSDITQVKFSSDATTAKRQISSILTTKTTTIQASGYRLEAMRMMKTSLILGVDDTKKEKDK